MNDISASSTFESEAKKKWCPFSREIHRYRCQGVISSLSFFLSANRDIEGNPTSGSLCLGSACMAWYEEGRCLLMNPPLSTSLEKRRLEAEKNA